MFLGAFSGFHVEVAQLEALNPLEYLHFSVPLYLAVILKLLLLGTFQVFLPLNGVFASRILGLDEFILFLKGPVGHVSLATSQFT